MITLITCGEMGGVTRRVIQGDLESVTPVDEATDEMLQHSTWHNEHLIKE